MSLADNRTHLQDCESNTDVSGETTAAPTAAVNDSGAVIEGTNSIAFQVDDAQEMLIFDQDSAAATFSIDMTDVTVYMNVKHNLGESFANLGGQIVFGDTADGGAGDTVGYNVNGNDVAGFPYLFRFTSIKLDVSVIVASPGTNDVDYFQYSGTEAGLNHAAVLQIGYGSFNVEKAISTGKNAWVDGIYYIANTVSATTGFAVSIQGGTVSTPETMVDVAGDDVAVGMGLFNNPKGDEFGFFGPTEWGDDAADSYFTSEDQQWYFVGDNQGGHTVADGHFPFRLVGDSSSTNSFVIERITIVSVGTRASWDLSHADMDFVQLTSCTLVGLAPITFPTVDVDKFCNDSVFIDCDQVYLSTMDADNLTFNGAFDPLGAILWDANSDEEVQNGLTFNSDGTGHAIEISLNTASLTTFNITDYSVSGYETTSDGSTGNTVFIVDNALDGDVDINVTGGTGTFSYERAGGYTGTVQVISSVTVTVKCVNAVTGANLEGVSVNLGTTGFGSNDVIDFALTNASGEVSVSFTGSTPQAVNGFAAQGTQIPTFKRAGITGTITSAGVLLVVPMASDD